MKFVIAAIALTACCLSNAYAQDFVAVKVEAENYATKHSDWRVTSRGNTPNVRPDPDGSHANSASGGTYMELLPDTRVTHSDPLQTGRNFWNAAGTGPSMSYNVNIPEAGRYLVFAKAYSTGTEDNGIHVGLNNQNPESGQRMQWCNGKNKWTWSSAQRISSNHCGTERTIYLNFSFAGANTVIFSAREDGFELDQFILLKTNNDSCKPNDDDQIVCNTGTSSVATQNNTSSQTPAATTQSTTARETTTTTMETLVTTSSFAITTCASAASDPDGDGYGWENSQSCLITADSEAATSNSSAAVANIAGTRTDQAVCASASSDSDGDGWGWENDQSCRVESTAAPVGTMYCASADSDSDGDGWGWENSQSCIVR